MLYNHSLSIYGEYTSIFIALLVARSISQQVIESVLFSFLMEKKTGETKQNRKPKREEQCYTTDVSLKR